MPLIDDIARLEHEGVAAFAAATSPDAVEAVRIEFLGRQGREKAVSDAFAQGAPDEKRTAGKPLNAAKEALRQAWQAAQARVAAASEDPPIDVTEPRASHQLGSIHPLSQLAWEVEQVFRSMGYAVVDGPHIELDQYNFGRLNIAEDHPARDAQDTFWLSRADGQPRLLRTHTSPVQARTYELVGKGLLTPPFRRVVVGRVFRYEAVDATHDNTFTQVEGFVVDEGITIGNLVGTLTTMLTALLGRDDVEVRLRPSFFPFVEPGFEVDVRLAKAEAGTRFASWVELLGCGIVHPKVLAAGAASLSGMTGFAFGMGLERLAMIRHGIADIRVFNGADLRSLRQFAAR